MEPSATVVRLIGVFKMVKVLLLIGVAIVLFHERHRDATPEAVRLFEHLGIAPGSHVARESIAQVNGMSAHKLELYAALCVAFAAVFATEGTGLLLRKHWAEWLTVVVTASFTPFEVYELAHRPTAMRVATLAINALVVVYLLVRIHTRKHGSAPRHSMRVRGQDFRAL